MYDVTVSKLGVIWRMCCVPGSGRNISVLFPLFCLFVFRTDGLCQNNEFLFNYVINLIYLEACSVRLDRSICVWIEPRVVEGTGLNRGSSTGPSFQWTAGYLIDSCSSTRFLNKYWPNSSFTLNRGSEKENDLVVWPAGHFFRHGNKLRIFVSSYT